MLMLMFKITWLTEASPGFWAKVNPEGDEEDGRLCLAHPGTAVSKRFSALGPVHREGVAPDQMEQACLLDQNDAKFIYSYSL